MDGDRSGLENEFEAPFGWLHQFGLPRRPSQESPEQPVRGTHVRSLCCMVCLEREDYVLGGRKWDSSIKRAYEPGCWKITVKWWR